MNLTQDQIKSLNDKFEGSKTEDILRWAHDTFGSRAAIGTSFQGAGLVMIDLAQKNHIPLSIFTLDTGLLFPETHDLKKRLEEFFKLNIESLEPELTLDAQAKLKGPELWTRDPDGCCSLRKVEPLTRKLNTLDCWITGLRRQQSDTRANVGIIELYEFDPIQNKEIVKLNPMANWTREAVWEYLKKNKIPYNALHDQGYRSIGCIPCTSKTAGGGENERAGRWIGFNKTECGIHTFMKRKGNEG